MFSPAPLKKLNLSVKRKARPQAMEITEMPPPSKTRIITKKPVFSKKNNPYKAIHRFKRTYRKNKYLIYAMNIFPNANMNIDKDDYALYNILNWIKNNGDIEHEFYLYCSSERMEYLVGKFIGLWKDENEWVNYHKL